MKVFVDFHHAGLLQSFILLFEKRLGGSVYRPIGIEWADEGYWHVYDHPATRQQFLTYAQGYRPIDGTLPLNRIENVQDGVFYCQDIDSGQYNKAISLQKFMEMDIDIVIASIPKHIKPFQDLCNRHPKKPKFIYQIGNAWNVNPDDNVQNVMASAKVEIPPGVNHVIYHQEFDLEKFNCREPTENLIISSFVNCFSIDGMFERDWKLFEEVERQMPEFKFLCKGGQCRDGAAHGSEQLSDAIGWSRFIWHTKSGGDGYGHILHNSYAMGRPMIINKSYYQGKMAEDLLTDGETCIDITGLPADKIVEKIRYYNQPDKYKIMCEKAYQKFQQVVDFDKEALTIANFLNML